MNVIVEKSIWMLWKIDLFWACLIKKKWFLCECIYIYIFLIGIVVGGVQLGPLGTAAANGLLCQPRVIMMMMQKLVEWLAGETEVLGENLPECRFVHYKTHMFCPDANPGHRGGKPATKRLSYGTAYIYGCMCGTVGRILFIFCIEEFVHRRSVPHETEHPSSKE
jgi:hypothetical protein